MIDDAYVAAAAREICYDSKCQRGQAEEVTAMERMPLTDRDKKSFFQTNAESVFKL